MKLLVGDGPLNLAVVDALARLRLAARHAGGRMCLKDVSPELEELLDLAGLRREVGGQIESREELLALEEGVEPGHTVA